MILSAPGFPNYEVTDDGQVWSKPRPMEFPVST